MSTEIAVLFRKSSVVARGLLLGAIIFSSQTVFAELNWISANWDNDVMAGKDGGRLYQWNLFFLAPA